MANTTQASGILALWNDRDPAEAAFYEHWYQGEHLPERLAVPGFLRGRRYESVGAGPQFFTYYEVAAPEVLESEAYLARLNNPTPATQRIMTSIFTGMSRTVCVRQRVLGDQRGSFAVTAKLADSESFDKLAKWLDELAVDAEVARIECWRAAPSSNRDLTTEEQIRGADDKIAACLMVECIRLDAARRVARDIERRAKRADGLVTAHEVGVYQFLVELQSAPEAA